MKRGHRSTFKPEASVVDAALDAIDAGALRELVRGVLPWLDDKLHAKVSGEIIDRAARSKGEWTPDAPCDERVAEVLEFAEAAQRVGYADPSEVDDYLRQGMNAFLAKDYRAAFQIFGALIVPLSEGEIDLGQHEMLDEVLGVEIADCAAQYVVAMYMTAAPAHRAKAVKTAIDDMSAAGHFWHPLEQIERVAVEPLPDFDVFLKGWNDLVRELAEGERHNEWDTDVDRWRREVTLRLDGTDGLAAIARSTKRSDDLRAWCRALVEARDWKAALVAYDEAAETVSDKSYARGDLLDGAALAAQELGRKDLPKYLERAWGTEPSLLRLRRWLGSATSKQALKKRVAAAIEACPKKEHGQLAFLHVLNGDMASAAKLLTRAPGLGWSRSEHPGSLLFPLFCRMLGSTIQDLGLDTGYRGHRDFDELEMIGRDRDEPRLHSPSVEDVLALAGSDKVEDSFARTAMLKAMQKAAEKRLDGVTENKRRRYYGHAASLAAACMAVDETNNSSKWFAAIRDEYRRYPALQRELNRYGGGQ
jgi:hypothetical protein